MTQVKQGPEVSGLIARKLDYDLLLQGIEGILEVWNIGTPSAQGNDIGVGGGAIRGRHKLAEDLANFLINTVDSAELRTITVDLPEHSTMGDIREAQGTIFNASTEYVDWELLHGGRPDAISSPGTLLLAIAHQLDAKARR